MTHLTRLMAALYWRAGVTAMAETYVRARVAPVTPLVGHQFIPHCPHLLGLNEFNNGSIELSNRNFAPNALHYLRPFTVQTSGGDPPRLNSSF